jgi:hypothetical protein
MVTTIKQVARVTPELPVDPASRTLTISASPEQLAVVDWIVNELDAKKAESAESGGAPKLHQFTAADGNKVDIFYLDPAAKPRDIQEILTVLRQVVEVNRLFSYAPRNAIGDEHKMPGAPDDVIRIFHWNSSLTPTQVQQLTHAIRRDAEVSHLFTYFNTHALAVRGTAAQLSKASEIISGPPPSQ